MAKKALAKFDQHRFDVRIPALRLLRFNPDLTIPASFYDYIGNQIDMRPDGLMLI
jgi:hypothetical protein